MPITRDQEHAVSVEQMKQVERLVQIILMPLQGKNAILVEQALLWSYCNVAEGVRKMPASTRSKRASLIVSKGARAFVEAINEVAALDDATVDALCAGASTCRH